MKLVIVESPSKAKKIAGYLGAGYTVKASVGHIRDLPTNEMGVDVQNGFKPTYVISEDKGKVVSELRKLAESASEVYLAADPDREGEAIAWHVRQVLKLGENYKRITFNEVNKAAILSAMKSPRKIDIAMVAAQETRRILDRIFGYEVSPALSNATGIERLSGGRVQSPCVGLIVDREDAINSFQPKDHYTATIKLVNGLELTLNTDPLKDADGLVRDASVIDALLANLDAVEITTAEKKPTKKAPKGLFTTAELQQVASTKLGLSPSQTSKLAQELYQDGRVTYIRTDDPNISDDGWNKVVAQLEADGLPTVDKKRKWKAKDANAQEGHEGIRPTDMSARPTTGSDIEKLYRLIYERALATAAVDGVDLASTVIAAAQHEGQVFEFKATGKVVEEQGWRALMSIETGEAKDNELPYLPDVGVICQVIEKERKDQVTKPPARFTEATLLKEMEKRGIGRPSTYASIFAVIFKREYVTVSEGRQIVPTDLGRVVVEALRPFEFMRYEYTAELEKQLDRIANQELKLIQVVQPAYGQLIEDLPKIRADQSKVKAFQQSNQVECPKCGKPLKRLPKKNNPKQFFWVHINEADAEGCEKFVDDMRGKPYFADQQNYSCELCGGALNRVYSSKQKKYFWFHKETTNCAKQVYDDRNGKPVIDAAACPGCGKPIKRLKSKQPGKGFFWVHINQGDAEGCIKYVSDVRGKPALESSA